MRMIRPSFLSEAIEMWVATSQYLTAVFELLPSRRKAAALERVRASAEAVFWNVIAAERARAAAVAAEADAKARRLAWRPVEAGISRAVIAAASQSALCEPVAHGIGRDATAAIGSYVELRAKGYDAEWPTPADSTAPDHAAALEMFVDATTREHENAARDALAAVARQPGPRPFVLARARDAMLVRTGAAGGVAAVLNVLRASDPRARPATIKPGIEAATGEVISGGVSKTRLVIPVACSKWHEQKFLSGRAVLRSSLIVRRGDRWFMCAQFEFPVRAVRLTGARLGVDRGIVNPVASAVTAADGRVRAVRKPAGSDIGQSIRVADEKRRAEQKRRGVTSRRHVSRVDHALHRLANGIVADARAFGARVVVEKLDGFKQTIVATRPKGDRKGGWRRTLKRAQLGKLEQLVGYKLALAGLPPPREVVAAGTSITCPACAARDPKSRPEQDRFACTSCGFSAHADSVGAVNIARRGIAMEGIKKGDKLAPAEQDIVARLRSRAGCGLGPLAGVYAAASGFVAAHAAADALYEGTLPLDAPAGQKSKPRIQKARERLLAERGAAFSTVSATGKAQSPEGLGP